jgi:hypothetical protein
MVRKAQDCYIRGSSLNIRFNERNPDPANLLATRSIVSRDVVYDPKGPIG